MCLLEYYRLSSVFKNCLPKPSTKKLLNWLLSPRKEFFVHRIQLLNFRFHFAFKVVYVFSFASIFVVSDVTTLMFFTWMKYNIIFFCYFAECSCPNWANTPFVAVLWDTLDAREAQCLWIIGVVTSCCEPEQEESFGKLVGRGQTGMQWGTRRSCEGILCNMV